MGHYPCYRNPSYIFVNGSLSFLEEPILCLIVTWPFSLVRESWERHHFYLYYYFMMTQGSQYIQWFMGAPYEKDINMAEMIIGWLQWQRESISLQDGFSDRGSQLQILWYYMVFYDYQEGLDIGINWETLRLGYRPWYLVRRDRSSRLQGQVLSLVEDFLWERLIPVMLMSLEQG